MICPKCGVHDSENGLGVHIRLAAHKASSLLDSIFNGTPLPTLPPAKDNVYCTECDYVAPDAEQYVKDMESSKYKP